MVDLMSLLRDVLVCSFQVWMLNDFGKNMFPYRVEPLWKRIGVYFAAALCIFIANHMGTTLFNIAIIPASYTIAAIIIFQGSKWKKVMGFTFGDEAEYLAIPTDKIFENLGKKYGRILSELGFTEYTLIGHCVGGLIALETAHYLKDKGKNVSSVTL